MFSSVGTELTIPHTPCAKMPSCKHSEDKGSVELVAVAVVNKNVKCIHALLADVALLAPSETRHGNPVFLLQREVDEYFTRNFAGTPTNGHCIDAPH